MKEPQKKKVCIEVYACNYSSLNYGNWMYSFSISNPEIENSFVSINYSNTDKNTDILRFEYVSHNFVVSTAEGGLVSKLDSITINEEVYRNVLFLNYQNPTRLAEYYKKAYYAPNIGLIKCVTREGKIWELVRYQIKP